MNKQIILVVSLLLSQISHVVAKVETTISPAVFHKKVMKIAERKKIKVSHSGHLTLKEKQEILDGVLENIFDASNKEKFKAHADFVAMLFCNDKRHQYKEMVEILVKNKECNNSIMFMCSVLVPLKQKAPKEVVDKVETLINQHGGAFKVRPILESKLC